MDDKHPASEPEAEELTEQENMDTTQAQPDDDRPEAPEAPEKAEKRPAPKRRKADTAEETPRRSRTLRRILAGILTLLLIVLAVLVFVFRDELTGAGLRRIFGREAAEAAAREAFTYETGAEQVFAPAGDGLAVASGACVQLLRSDGSTVFKQVVSYERPAVFGSEKGALFCELGGTGCIFADFDGAFRSPEKGGDILTAGMNENGWFCLVTAEPGYKALVSVYNSACEKQYEWWSGSGYVLRAALSPDNRTLAVLCAEQEGARLHFFALNSETERGSAAVADTLLIDLCYLSNDSVCAVGEQGLWFFSDTGTERGQYLLDGRYLLDYEFGRAGFVTVFAGAYRSGAGGTLLTLGSDGRVQGSAALERDVISLSAVGRQVLVMTGDSLALYNQDLVRQSANETLMTAKRAILRPAGDILLLHAYSAERFSF